NKYAQKEIYISGMKGMSIPQLSFDNHSAYITDRTSLNSVTTKTSYHIEQTIPAPDGFYTIYPNIEQDGRDYLMTDNTNVPIKGGFCVKNSSPYKKNLYWKDTGYSREETLSSNTSTLSIGTTALFGQEINAGERNETQLIQAPTSVEITGGNGPTLNERYGTNISISGNYLAVGTKVTQNANVYVYYKNQATGVYAIQKIITIPTELSGLDSNFGESLSISNNYLAVSAKSQDKVYLYKRKGTNWTQIKSWDGVDDFSIDSTAFGGSLELTDNYLAIGVNDTASSVNNRVFLRGKNVGGTDNWGAVKTFTYPGSNHSSVSTKDDEQFGSNSSIDGDYIIIGARNADAYSGSAEIAGAGLAFIFYRHQGGRDQWGLQETLHAQQTNGTNDVTTTNARFGANVSIKGKYALVGCPRVDDTGNQDGAAYMYFRTGTQWAIQQKIVPSSRVAEDLFGSGCSISPQAIYCTTSAKDGGKAYVFKRTGTTWTQSSILENSTSISNDKFGFNIEYDGFNIIVSANGNNASDGTEATKGYVCIFNQTNTLDDGNGILAIDDHTTHELYLDGETQKLSIDYSFTNNTTLSTTSTITTNTVVEHSIDGWRKIYETGRQFNCVVIKGKYIGYGGKIEFHNKENILEHPEGYEVKQIVYENDNPLTPSNKFFINLHKKQTDFISSTSNERIIPSSSLYKNLTMLENNGLFTDNHVIGTGGSVYKKDRDAPVNIESDFMNMCVTG
ncbi:MAG: hypothetical protein HOK72_05095, partial [Flavobacteriales bacterium]|nr:hypothetical protein [Flavobacteriales bacterium]